MLRILFVLLILIYPVNAKAQNGIFFLDVDYLINNSDLGKKMVNNLKKINDQNISEFKKYETNLKKKDEEINKVKNIISKDELNIKIQNLTLEISQYNENKDKIIKEYNDLKNSELESFFNKISPLIEEFMEINSIQFILDKKNIFIANTNYDITNNLIKFLNKKIKND